VSAPTAGSIDALLHAATAHGFTTGNTVLAAVANAIPANASLIVNFNDNLTDQTTNFTLTPNSPVYSTDVPYAGAGKSLILPGGTGVYKATMADSPLLDFGSGDFAISFWYKDGGTTVDYGRILSRSLTTNWIGWQIWYRTGAGASLRFAWSSNNTDWPDLTFSLGTTTTSWAHHAVVRKGNTLYGLKNGAVVATKDITGLTIASGSGHTPSIGFAPGDLATGFLDGLEIYKGTSRGWESGYTYPTVEFTTDSIPTEIPCTAAGRALLDDATAADQRTTLGAAASGAATSSGLTLATSRLLGRTTASTGAIEEISATSPLSLASGALSIPAATASVPGHATAAQISKLDGIAAYATVGIPPPATPEQGDVLYYDGSAWARLAHGTSGQFLKTQGHGANPAWDSPAGGSSRWTAVANYTTTPASTSTITMGTDQTATLLPGLPLRYTWNGTTYYGVISACTASLLTIRGAPLSTSYATTLDVGTPEMVTQMHVSVPGFFEDATNTGLLASDCYQVLKWVGSRAYCVGYNAKSQTADSGANQPSVQVTWDGNAISDSNSSAGIRPTASWVATGVDIITTGTPPNYQVDNNEALEISVTKNSTGDAADLNVDIIMVVP
jgi:hypothetical protein